MRKYELTDGTRRQYGRTLHRIRALRGIPRHGVKVGELGGWVESESNLSQNDDAWISENANVMGSAHVSENALVRESARVYGESLVDGNALVSGNARVGVNAHVGENAHIGEYALVCGTGVVRGDSLVDGDADVDRDALIDSNACLLTATIYTSQRLYATAFRQRDGSWRVRVGCWSGSIPELRALAESDEWVETPPEDIEEARPELLAFVALCEARAARTVL